MDILNSLLQGLAIMLEPTALLWVIAGSIVGTFVGALPGLGPSAGVAMLLPLSFALPPAQGLSLLISVYMGCMYGGRISSILINVPGDSAAIMTCVDGYPLTTQGRGGVALGISGLASFLGGCIGLLFMTFFTPPLADAALAFGPAEQFSLMVFALFAIGVVADVTSVKGVLMVVLGLLLATVGSEHVTGKARLTFGIPQILDGIDFVPVAIGLFGLTEVLSGMQESLEKRILHFAVKLKNLLPSLAEVKSVLKVLLFSALIGIGCGVLPGAGATIATFISYSASKKVANKPDDYGQGSLEGLTAAESANNACVAGALTPMLALGIPGSSVAAMIMGGFIIHDLQPGPMMFVKSADVAWAIIAGLWITNLALLFINIAMIPFFIMLLRMAQPVLYPTVGVLCVLGTYTIHQSMFDVIVMIIFGFLGLLLKKTNYPVAGLLLALILGTKIEQTFRQALIMSHGSYDIFLLKPISLVFMLGTLLVLLYPTIRLLSKRLRARG